MNDISKRIMKLFKDSGASYGEVSEKTGIPKSALHRYANGDTPKIPINRIEQIAKYFNVSAEYIMGWNKEEPTAIDKTWELYQSLSEENKVAAENYLKFLASNQDKD